MGERRLTATCGLFLLALTMLLSGIGEAVDRTVYWEAEREQSSGARYRYRYYVRGMKVHGEYVQLDVSPPIKTVKVYDETGQFAFEPTVMLDKRLRKVVVRWQRGSTSVQIARDGARYRMRADEYLSAFFGDPTTLLKLRKAQGAKRVGTATLEGRPCEVYSWEIRGLDGNKRGEELLFVRQGRVLKIVSEAKGGWKTLKGVIESFERATTTYTVVKVGIEIPDSIFAVPPKGWRLISEDELRRIESLESERFRKEHQAQLQRQFGAKRSSNAEKRIRQVLYLCAYICLAVLVVLLIVLRKRN